VGMSLACMVTSLKNGQAVRHLFRVASGLDSMVLGETEITGQVKTAYEAARTAHLTGRSAEPGLSKGVPNR